MKNKKVVEERVSAAVVAKAVEKEAVPLMEALRKIKVIRNNTDYELAGSVLKQLKKMLKVADEKHAAIVNPIKQSIKETDSLFKPFKTEMLEVEKHTKGIMLAYIERQDEKIKSLEAKVEAGKVTINKYAREAQNLQVTSTSATKRELQVVEIVDLSIVPREYLVPDMVAIKEAMKAGKKVKGCQWATKTSISI